MKIFTSSKTAISFCKKGSAISMGNYDGVHLGHREIIKRLITHAKQKGLPSVIYTFNPHPVTVLAPHVAPLLLNTLDQKIELLKECGIDAVVLEPFTKEFSHFFPEVFFKTFVLQKLNAKFIIVGYDFTFGARRLGNIETLERLSFEHNIACEIVEARLKGNTLVSSSLVRSYVADGKTKKVIPLLSRPYFIEGTVIKGAERGTKMGIPTANLRPENELIPKEGVYATKTKIHGKIINSITSIGKNPTFRLKSSSIETHLFHWKKNIYGNKIRIYFFKRIRNIQKFASSWKLLSQIKKDFLLAKKELNVQSLE